MHRSSRDVHEECSTSDKAEERRAKAESKSPRQWFMELWAGSHYGTMVEDADGTWRRSC